MLKGAVAVPGFSILSMDYMHVGLIRRHSIRPNLVLIRPCVKYMITGSYIEVYPFYAEATSDIDIMFYFTDMIGINTIENIKEDFKGTVIHFDFDIRPGYVRLQQKDVNMINERMPRWQWHTEKQGPAVNIPIEIRQTSTLKYYPPSDNVFSIRCPGWPEIASDWKSRVRKSGWPSKEIIETVFDNGYHLVEKPHPFDPEDKLLWRLSFSMAEVYLIDNFLPEQRFVYYVLRRIKQNVTGKCEDKQHSICTYYFKTMMLWECEEQPKEFWDVDKMESTIAEILLKIIACLIEKRISHYFISGWNILDHLTDEHDFDEGVCLLLEYTDQEKFR